MRWWIIDDALKDRRGHYFEYGRSFKEGIEACGDSVDFFVEKNAEDWLVDALGAKPTMPHCIWRRMSDPKGKLVKMLRLPSHGLDTFRALRRIFRQHEAPDLVFFPSTFTHHLIGIVPFIKRFSRQAESRFLLFFPSVPIYFDTNDQAARIKPDPSAKLFPRLIRSLANEVESGRVILGVETVAMQAALSGICGLPFTYFPHPVAFSTNSNLTIPRDGKTPLFGCYGPARWEKGSDSLIAGIEALLRQNPDIKARFAIQWLDDFKDPSGAWVTRSEFLRNHPSVEFIESFFAPDGGYRRQIERTDVMILPYRDPYRFRLSRVAIEAMIAGIPILSTRNTTLFDQASEHGVCLPLEEPAADSIPLSILNALSFFDDLTSRARATAAIASSHFSVETFRTIWMSSTTVPKTKEISVSK